MFTAVGILKGEVGAGKKGSMRRRINKD